MRWVLSLLVVANVFAFAMLHDWLPPWLAGDREPRRLAQQIDADRLRIVPPERLGAPPARPSAGRPQPSTGQRSASQRSASQPAAGQPVANAGRSAPTAAAAVTPPLEPSPGASPSQSIDKPLQAASGVSGGVPARENEAAPEPAGDVLAQATDSVCTAFGPLDEARANRLRAALEAAGARVEATRIEQAANYFVYAPPAESLADAQRRLEELRRIGHDDAFLMQEGALRLGVSIGLYRSQDMARALVARLEGLGQTDLRIVPRGAITIRVQLQAHWPDQAAAAAASAIAGRFDLQTRECSVDRP